MNSVENGKVSKVRCDCPRCAEYLKTNIKCKIGRDTSKVKYCKWYYAIKKVGKKSVAPKAKTMLEVIASINNSISEQKRKFSESLNTKDNSKYIKRYVCGIYAIRNNLNGKMYIGSSTNIRSRYEAHFRGLCNNSGINKKL